MTPDHDELEAARHAVMEGATMSTQEQVDEVLGMMNECQRLAADVGNACFEGEVT